MFKIQFPSGFLLAIMFITFTIFSCQKEEFGEVIPLEEQTFENLSATLKSDNDCKDKVKSIQREFEKNFYSDKMSKEVFQANFGMIDWSSNGADCDLVDPEFFSIFPLRSIVNKKDLQSLLVITQTGEKAESFFTIVNKTHFFHVLGNTDAGSVTSEVNEFANLFAALETEPHDPGSEVSTASCPGCPEWGPNRWKNFWKAVAKFITSGGSGSGGGNTGPYISPGVITFWNNTPPSTGGNNIPGGGSNSGNEPALCTSEKDALTFEELELVLDNLTQYYNEFGVNSTSGTPLIEMLQPGCAGLDYTEFRSCLNASILCSINENYDLSDDEASCIRNSPQLSLDINGFLNGSEPNRDYIVNFYLRLICEDNIDISFEAIRGILNSNQTFESQDNFDHDAYIILIDNVTGNTESQSDLSFLANHLKTQSNKKDILSYYGVISNLRLEDSEIKWTRSTELYDFVKTDVDALVKCGVPPANIEDWGDLANFTPPGNVLERLNELGPGYELQSLLDPNPSPSINLDYFSVEISQMPNDPNTGEVYTQKQFFDYFRKNINNFVYAGNSQFDPLTSNDGDIWESNDPTGAAISIDIDVIPFTGIGDDGTVICSQAEENFWIFSTLTAPSAISSGQSPFALSWPDGFHPVSGNRQFGYFTNSAGNMEIYTRGVDRFFPLTQNEDSWAGYLVGYLVENTAFGGADDLWESLQERITSFVNNSPQNGIANIIDPVKLRPPTGDALLTLLKQSEPITSIPCQ